MRLLFVSFTKLLFPPISSFSVTIFVGVDPSNIFPYHLAEGKTTLSIHVRGGARSQHTNVGRHRAATSCCANGCSVIVLSSMWGFLRERQISVCARQNGCRTWTRAGPRAPSRRSSSSGSSGRSVRHQRARAG